MEVKEIKEKIKQTKEKRKYQIFNIIQYKLQNLSKRSSEYGFEKGYRLFKE